MYLFREFNHFWLSYPSLFYGVSLLLGFYSLFDRMTLLPIIILWVPFIFLKQYKQLIISVLLFISSAIYGSHYYQFPAPPDEGIEGKAYVSIDSLSSHKTFFGKMWIYRCRLNQFFPNDSSQSIARGVKCIISLPQRGTLQRPLATQDYVVTGTLQLSDQGQYILKVDKEVAWLAVEGSWSLAEWRYKAKKWLSDWITQQFSHSKSATFLSSLAIGEFDDVLMQLEFARFGVQHIMAISGFHFSILAGILGFFLRMFLPPRIVAMALILFVSLYFLFLGTSASILRSWVAITIAMFGQFLCRQSKALNALGVGLLAVIVLDPLLTQSVGFQFSFLATAAILIGFAPLDRLLCEILPKRPLSQMIEMNAMNQHGYCLLVWFRQGFALSIVITLLTWPIMIYYFQKFPVMSLLYNLFFPFFVSISMFFLLIGLVLGPLGGIIHVINDRYTNWTLNLLYNMPETIDINYTWDSMPKEFLILYVIVFLLIGIGINNFRDA